MQLPAAFALAPFVLLNFVQSGIHRPTEGFQLKLVIHRQAAELVGSMAILYLMAPAAVPQEASHLAHSVFQWKP